MTGWFRNVALGGAMLVVLAGCGSESSVGEGVDLGFEEGTGQRLGEGQEPDEATGGGEVAPSTAPTAPTVATTAPPALTTPPTTGQHVALEVRILDDNQPSQFEPRLARIYAGTCVRFANHDTVDRSVVADGGSFSSGAIAPGGSWVVCPSEAGTYNYTDGTRPYAVGTLEVLASG